MKKLVILGITIYSFAQLTNAATLNVKPYGTTQDGQKLNSIPWAITKESQFLLLASVV